MRVLGGKLTADGLDDTAHPLFLFLNIYCIYTNLSQTFSTSNIQTSGYLFLSTCCFSVEKGLKASTLGAVVFLSPFSFGCIVCQASY